MGKTKKSYSYGIISRITIEINRNLEKNFTKQKMDNKYQSISINPAGKLSKYLLISSIILLVFFSLARSSQAATYYVDQNHPQASDSNPGTEDLPWKTIVKAAKTLQAGDTVFVKEGTYYNQRQKGEYSECGLPDSGVCGIKPQNSGTAQSPIVYSAYPGHKVIIDQGGEDQQYIKSLGKSYNGFYIFNKSYITISGFEIRNTWGSGIQTSDGSSYITVEKSIIHDANAGDNIGAISFDSCSHCIARGNKLYNVFVNGDMSNQNASAIGSNYDMEYALIENNEMFNAANGVFHKRSSGNKGAIIRKNLMHDLKLYCIRYSVGGVGDPAHLNQEVYQNICYNTPTGIFASTYETATPSTGMVVYNNVFHTSDSGIVIGGYKDVQIWNNIFFENGNTGEKAAIITIGDPNQNSISYSDFNCFYPYANFTLNLYHSSEQRYNTLSSWQKGTGFDLNSLNINPLFNNPSQPDYHLQNNSPCRNSGIDRQDYDGDGNTTERINMGAYITGNETIGLIPSSDTTPPAAPRNLTII